MTEREAAIIAARAAKDPASRGALEHWFYAYLTTKVAPDGVLITQIRAALSRTVADFHLEQIGDQGNEQKEVKQ